MKSSNILRRTGVLSILALMAIGFLALGAAAVRAQETGPATTPTTTAASITPATVPALAASSADADRVWRETYRATQDPMPPKEWQDKDPSQQEIVNYYLPKLLAGADKAKDFYTKYPDHAKAEAARKAEYRLLTIAVHQFGDNSLNDRLAVVILTRLKDPKLSDDERAVLIHDQSMPDSGRAALMQDPNTAEDDKYALRLTEVAKLTDKLPDGLDDFLKKVEALRTDYPKHAEVYQLLMIAMQASSGDQAKAIAKTIADSDAPDQIKDMAKGMLRSMDAIGKPLDIHFTAFDGREVDISHLKGKVVLVDYWATWCGPCMEEVPTVKAAYEKLHDQGFEIVGISFDNDRDALTKFLQKEKTPWPQFFDGKQWQNKFGVQYGINSIPTMWLVDKQGNLRDVNARGALEEKVTKLLKE